MAGHDTCCSELRIITGPSKKKETRAITGKAAKFPQTTSARGDSEWIFFVNIFPADHENEASNIKIKPNKVPPPFK